MPSTPPCTASCCHLCSGFLGSPDLGRILSWGPAVKWVQQCSQEGGLVLSHGTKEGCVRYKVVR